MSLLVSLLAGGSGLRAANAGVNASSHNVTNASTPGYSRRRVDLSTAVPVRQGGVWYGLGVNTDRIARPIDTLLQARRVVQTGLSASADATSRALATVESLYGSADSTGPREALDNLFGALDDATADPADPALRRQVIDSASAFARTVSETARRLDASLGDFEDTLQATLTGVNDQLAQVADLNAKLVAAGGGFSAGDLADQRDELVRQLAESIGATADYAQDGSVTVFLGGHAVVSGAESRTVSFDTSSGTPTLAVSAGKGSLDVTGSAGGTMGGLIEAWDATRGWLDDLDTAASSFADAFNTQHAAGYDRAGAPGGAVFSYTAGSAASTLAVDAALDADSDLLALAGNPTAYAGDDGNLRSLAALRDSPMVGTRSAVESLTDLSSDIGVTVARFQNEATHQAAVLGDVEELHQAIVGVDLDEEATNLVRFQAAYQAAAKVIQTTDEMLGTLMELV